MSDAAPALDLRRDRRRRWLAYGVAIVASAAALVVRLAMSDVLGERPTLIIFTIPIMLSGYVGGLGPGLLATALCYLGAAYYLLPPLHCLAIDAPADRWQAFFGATCGIVISLLNEALHRSRRRHAEGDELFAKAFQLSPDCVVITRQSDRMVLRANDALCALWGGTRETIVGQRAGGYMDWQREEERIAFIQQLHAQGGSGEREATFRMSDGRLRDFSISCRLITLEGEACILTVMRDITEQKRAATSASWLVSIVTSSDDAIISKSLAGIITSWNSGAERIFGYTAAEAVGQSMLLVIPPERSAEEPEILARIARGEHVKHFETVRVRKDGTRIDISATISPITDATGRIVGASKIARDITVRKSHEREISRLTRLYAALSQVNQAIVLKTSPEALFTEICRALVEAGGFRMAWIGQLDPATHRVNPVGQWGEDARFLPSAVIYTDDRPEGRGLVGTAIREDRCCISNNLPADARVSPWRQGTDDSGYLASGVFPIRCGGKIFGAIIVAAGEINFFQDREIELLQEAAGDVSFALDNFAREAARHHVESTLDAERTLLRTLFDLLPDYLYVKDHESRFLACNERCARRFGLASHRELLGRTDAEFFPAHAAAHYRRDEERVLAGASIVNQEEVVIWPGGDREVLLTNKLPLRDAAGKITGIVGCGRDITEHKKAAEALQLHEEQLQLYVEHCPAAIAMFDRNMCYLVASRRWREDYHLGEESPIGRSHYDLFPNLPERWLEVHRRCFAGAVEKSSEDSFVRADGTTAWIRWEVRPWRQPDGAIGGIIIFAEDITEHKAAEDKLREQLAELLRWQDVMVNREDRLQTLKAEVNELLARQNQPPRYSSPSAS